MNCKHIHESLRNVYQRMAKILTLILMVGVFLLPSEYTQAQTQCNFKSGSVTLVLSGQSTGANITSQLVLTDASGIIKYVSAANNTTLNNVVSGNYQAYGVTYDSSTNPNLAVNGNINSVGFCYKTTPISLSVCDCNNATGILSASVSGQTTQTNQVNKYVLTDGKGIILSIDNLPTFSGYGNGVYNIYSVSYNGNGIINGLSVNGNISNVSGTCVDISQGMGYVVCVPDLSIVKEGPATGTVGVNYNYTLSVTNNGVASTSGQVTVTDILPTGLTFVSGSGTGWSCSTPSPTSQNVTCATSSPITAGSTAPVINLTVTPTTTGTFNNTASVVGGGDVSSSTSSTVTTVVNNPATPNLIISKAGPVVATVGVPYEYTLTVNNNGTASTNGGKITVTDALVNGLTFVSGTGTGWTCSVSGQNVSCESNNVIARNGSNDIIIRVNPTITGDLTNTANVIGGGDNSLDPSGTVSTRVNAAPTPNLVILKTGSSTATVGTNFSYTLSVNNTGTGSSNGSITVQDILPAGITFVSATGTGWTCSAVGQTVTCNSSTAIIVNGSSNNITLVVNPSSVGTVTNNASVVGGGDTTPATSNDVVTTINAGPMPNLIISKSGPATGTVGVNYNYTLTANNTGTAATTGSITVSDVLPTGLSFVPGNNGTGWTCSAVGQTVTCTSSSVIAVNGSSSITIAVVAGQTGTFVNAATIIGGGDNTSSTSNSISTQINPAPTPDLTIVKSGPSTGTVGVNYDYTLTITNTGTAPTNAQISVTDILPTGLTFVSGTGNGWSCSATGQNVTCTTNNAIAAGTNSAITLTVNAALAGNYNNTATVAGGGITGNRGSNTVATNIGCPTNINPGTLRY